MANATADGWKKLSVELNLAERLNAGAPPVLVSANQIKALTGREPRLMTKFDTRESRPPALRGATILPVNNGEYAIVHGDGYADVSAPSTKLLWGWSQPIATLQTLPWKAGPSSESQVIDMAHASGLVDEFLQDTTRLTIRGRLRAPRFDFEFGVRGSAIPLSVEGVQVEVDSGFEGEHIHLVEAKLGTRSNFHVRQLYYPLRMWRALLPHKTVSTVFLSYSNRCLSLRRFVFEPEQSYHGLRLAKTADYYLDKSLPLPTLAELLDSTRLEALPLGVPFPQADDIRRVIDLVDAVAAGVETRQLSLRYGFVGRQADYYANAAAFVGLIQRSKAQLSLSELGQRFTSSTRSERELLLAQRLAALPVFRPALEQLQLSRAIPSLPFISELIARSTALRGETLGRRASTVCSWLKWVHDILHQRTMIE